MPTPSTQLALPQIAGTDSPDVPRDVNALIAAHEANAKYFATRDVLATGIVGHTVAGRPLVPADFTDMGLAIPTAIYGCDGVNDTSGNALNLTNKGSVPFTTGITGAASEAALFVGSTAQALYRADTGGSDPFRFRTCTIGCWFKSPKRGTTQYVVTKTTSTLADRGFALTVDSNNLALFQIAIIGTINAFQASTYCITDCCDDRLHFIVGTHDGDRTRIYVDGVMEGSAIVRGAMNGSAGPLNIGGYGADGSTAAGAPVFGKVDEVFLTSDVLTEDQIRNLYAVKLAHSMTRTPRRAGMSIRRRKRGALLVPGDFTTPNRIYNLDDLNDDSGNAVTLTANVGTGSITSIVGPDGVRAGARFYVGAHTGDSATDAGLPSGTATRTMGAWVRTSLVGTSAYVFSYGTIGTVFGFGVTSNGALVTTDGVTNINGPFIADGDWHHIAFVGDNSAADGLKEKVYLDARCVGVLTSFAGTTLGGANSLRTGALSNGTSPWTGAVARGFIVPSALTAEQIATIFMKSTLDQGSSPRPGGEFVEKLDATSVLFIGDQLDPQNKIDLELAA